MDRRQTLLGLLSASLAACGAPSRAPTGPVLPGAGLLADVDVLQRAFETLHPGLYRYNTPDRMQARFQVLRRALDHDQSLGEAYLAFSRFAATLRCGHTYANFFNQAKAVRAALFEHARCVPFEFRWIDGRMIVTRNRSQDPTLVPGTEVLAIEGVASREILARMMAVARADGSNDAKRIAWLQVQGEETLEAFDVFLPLLYPHIGPEPHLRVQGPGAGPARSVRVVALSTAERRAGRARAPAGPAPAADAPAWTLDLADPRVAVLRMPTWALYNSRWDWQGSLQQSFDDLARAATPALVIDLRANEGGNDVGHVLLAHLIDRDLPLPQYRRLVRYRKVPEDLLPYLDTWDPGFKDWGADAVAFDDRYLRLTRYDDDASGDVIRPLRPRYTGRVFVLVGATNSSATFQFAQQVQTARLGTLVGQTTGGNRRGINGGAFFFLRLPNSGLEIDLPLIGRFPVEPQPDAGIEPDMPVRRTVADVVAGRDAEMAAVMAMLGAR